MTEKSPFEWQLTKLQPLTQHSFDNLQQKADYFGRPFAIGDRVLQVVLITKAHCCGLRNDLVPLHEQSIPQLELKYRYSATKMGIPRYILRTL